MLIGSMGALSFALAVLLCVCTGAFETLTWMWLLPVCLVGFFLILAVLWFALLYLMAKRVDMEKDYEKDSPFYRGVITLTIGALFPLLRVHLKTKGLENAPKDGRFLLVCNHLHETDPVILLS